MSEAITFHFEGALADEHRMNFHESARFQYAAARLLVKLAQFRHSGKFVKKITNSSNFNVQLVAHTDGSFNINVESPPISANEENFINLPLASLIAYVSERLVEKIDETALENVALGTRARRAVIDSGQIEPGAALDQLVGATMRDGGLIAALPDDVRDLIRRRVAENYREQRLTLNESAIARIDFARS